MAWFVILTTETFEKNIKTQFREVRKRNILSRETFPLLPEYLNKLHNNYVICHIVPSKYFISDSVFIPIKTVFLSCLFLKEKLYLAVFKNPNTRMSYVLF